MKIHESVLLFRLPIYAQNKEQLLSEISSHVANKVVKNKENLTIFTPNPEQVMLSRRNPQFLATLLTGDILIPDGIGLIIAGRMLLKAQRPFNRIPGRVLVEHILNIANENKLSVFLLGGKGQTSKRLLEKLQNEYIHVRFFENSGFSSIKHQTIEEKRIILQSIKRAQPDIVLVAFGAPYQEEWVSINKQELQSYGVRLTMVVGGTFDILLGNIPKVPRFLEKLNLEWFWRLLIEPKRIGRQLWLPLFLATIFSEKLQDITAKK